MPWNDDLENPALDIAATNDSPLRIRAGPGTGKTFTMIRRIARLLESGEAPRQILVCTFTRTAVGDLVRELEALDVNGASCVRATTLHAFCFSVLAQNEVLEATGRVPRPLHDYETRFLLQDLNSKQFGGIRKREKRLKAFESAWARLQNEKPGWPNSPVDRQFHQQLLDWLIFHDAMLIGELIPEALRYFQNNPARLERIAFSHILVDEYQDLNVAEQELIWLISRNSQLAIIGDEDQSIYSFKHAHPEGIATFHERHRNTVDKTLNLCRRCPEKIITMANELISNNRHRTNRVLKAHHDNDTGVVHIVQWPNMEQEVQGLATLIHKYVHSGEVDPSQVLVLAPRRMLGYSIRDSLKEKGVSAHSFFHEEALEGDSTDLTKCYAQQAFTLLTLAAKAEDSTALRCWCGFGSPSLRSGAWNRVRILATQNNIPLATALNGIETGQFAVSYGKDLTERLRDLRGKLDHLAPLRGGALIEALFPESNPGVAQIRAMAESLDPDADAAQILKCLQAGIIQSELPTDVDYVRVMSLHKSKGLTADLVVVMGCIESLIPALNRNASQSQEERRAALEEQRRLFYVSITRTRKILILSSALSLPLKHAYRIMRVKGMRVTGRKRKMVETMMSRFIHELGPTRPVPTVGNRLLSSGSFASRRPL